MFRILHLYKESFRSLQPTIWILSLATCINRSGSMVVLFTSLYLTNELHFSITNAGICMSFYGVGSILGAFTGGWLADRRTVSSVMIFSLFSSGCILLFITIAKTPVAISAIIFSYSFVADLFRPCVSKATAAYSTSKNRARSISLTRLASNIGFSIGPVMGSLLVILIGYKWLYVIDAFTSFSAATLLFICLPKTQTHVGEKTEPVKVFSVYQDKRYLFFLGLVMLYGICFFQLFSSVPQYLNKECHYEMSTMGLLLGLNGLLVVLLEMPLVTTLEKKKKNSFKYVTIGSWLVPLAFFMLKVGGGAFIWSFLYLVTITVSEIYCLPFMMNYVLSRPVKKRQGQYSALYSISYGVANMIAPLLGLGIAGNYGFGTMFNFFILLGLVTTIGFIFLYRKVIPSTQQNDMVGVKENVELVTVKVKS